MSLTITPTRCEIHGDELEAVIDMMDSHTSSVTIKALQSPESWRELAEAVRLARNVEGRICRMLPRA